MGLTLNYVLVRRSLLIIFGCVAILIGGGLWAFSVYGPSIKDALHLTQTQINTAGSIGDAGNFCGGFSVGIVYDKFGSPVTLPLAATLIATGYGLVWLQLRGWIDSESPILLTIFFFITGQGMYGVFSSVIGENAKSFDVKHRGKVTGLLSGAGALSIGFYAQVYSLFFKNKLQIDWYLLFLMSTGGVILFCTLFVRRIAIPGQTGPTVRQRSVRLRNVSLLVHPEVFDSDKSESENFTEVEVGIEAESGLSNNSTIQNDEVNGSLLSYDKMVTKTPIPVPDITGIQLLMRIEFWLLFGIFFLLAGCSLMWINQIGSLVTSLKRSGDQNTLLTIFAFCNLAGRVVFGSLFDIFRKSVPVIAWVTLSGIILGLTHLMFAFWMSDLLIITAILTGLAYGGIFTAMVTILGLLFGLKYFAFNLGMILLAPAGGSFFYGFLSGVFYDRQKSIAHETVNCMGEDCWKDSFFLSAASCAVAVLLTLAVIYVQHRNAKRIARSASL